MSSCTRTRARTALQAHKIPRKKEATRRSPNLASSTLGVASSPKCKSPRSGTFSRCPRTHSLTHTVSSHTTVLSDTPTTTSWNLTDRVPPPESTRRKVTVRRWPALVSRSRGHSPPLTARAQRGNSRGKSPRHKNPLREIACGKLPTKLHTHTATHSERSDDLSRDLLQNILRKDILSAEFPRKRSVTSCPLHSPLKSKHGEKGTETRTLTTTHTH